MSCLLIFNAGNTPVMTTSWTACPEGDKSRITFLKSGLKDAGFGKHSHVSTESVVLSVPFNELVAAVKDASSAGIDLTDESPAATEQAPAPKP